MIERVRSRVHEFDVLHFHVDQVHLPLFRPYARKSITTLHGRLDVADLAALYREFDEMPLVSISGLAAKTVAVRQLGRHRLSRPRRAGMPLQPGPRGNYLAFLGRMSPEKGVERAIEIARRAGRRLRIAAKIDRTEEDYYRSRVAPLLSEPLVDFIGEVGEAENRGSWATPRRSSFRSTGRSRSGLP